jgi:hypothetical protein
MLRLSYRLHLMHVEHCKMYEVAMTRAHQYILLDLRMKNENLFDEEIIRRVEKRIPIEMNLLNIELFANM